MFADLLGDVRDRLAFGQLHDHRLEQEREPASRPRPRHRDRVHAVGGARHARHARVNERLVLEEVQMPPHALPRVMHRTRGLAAPRFRAGEPRTRREPDRDMQFPSAVLLVTELHARHPPRVRQLQGGGEQRRGIHTPKLPDQHHHPPRPTHPHQTAKGLSFFRYSPVPVSRYPSIPSRRCRYGCRNAWTALPGLVHWFRCSSLYWFRYLPVPVFWHASYFRLRQGFGSCQALACDSGSADDGEPLSLWL